jgi:uncharacterized protein YbjT (DUF2867 family)
MKILVTGASGNIGSELIKSLSKIEKGVEIIAGDFDVKRARNTLAEYSNLSFRHLDFNNPVTFDEALEGIGTIFLLRPPQLANVEKYFRPFLSKAKEKGIHRVMFLSVQGVENQKFIPHFKLEKLIIELGFNYIFLRPGYFMQNLTTTLLSDIKHNNRIYIPAGKLKLNWVDAADIGKVGAHLLMAFEKFKNRPFEITGNEFMGFDVVADIMTRQLSRKISYVSPNLFSFYRAKRKQGISRPMIFVLIMLHFLPRFKRNEARLTNVVRDITGTEPGNLKDFIKRENSKFSIE